MQGCVNVLAVDGGEGVNEGSPVNDDESFNNEDIVN